MIVAAHPWIRDPPEPDGDGPFVPPFWPPNPVGEPAYDASCGCEACGCDSDGQWPGYIADSAEDEPQGARKSVPDAQVGDTGQGGKPQGGGSGGGGETVNQVNPALGAAEVAYFDAFLEELVDAVDQGDNDAAWDAYEDYQGFMGQIGATLDHVDQDLVPRDESWADTAGNRHCDVWFADTCGDKPSSVADYSPASPPDDAIAWRARAVVEGYLQGEWSDCEREVIVAAWDLLVRNFDLAQWALCVATGNPDAGGCIEEILIGARPIVIQRRDCNQLADGWPVADPWEIAFEVAQYGAPLVFPYFVDLTDNTPELWLCTEHGNEGPRRTLYMSAVLFCSDPMYNQECGVVAMASTLLHELTHICWRALLEWDRGEFWPGFDEPRDCDVSYLVSNYFLWAAKTRFRGIAVAPCCGDWIPEPGRDDMSAGWAAGQHGEGCVDNQLRDPAVVLNATP